MSIEQTLEEQIGGLKLVYLDPGDTGGLLVELIES